MAPATKATTSATTAAVAFKAALADLVASLNASLGRGAYELNVDVLEGEVDLAGLDLGEATPGGADVAPAPRDQPRGVRRRQRGGAA